MCLSNIAGQAEFLNMISNEDQNDKATPEGYAALDADLEKFSKVNGLKLATFPHLTNCLQFAFEALDRLGINVGEDGRKILADAQRLSRGELP